MPNWCWSRVSIEADEEKISKLYGAMQKALSGNPCGADFGNEWLGNLLVYTGKSLEEIESGDIRCRGSIDDYDVEDCEVLHINMSTAWNPQFGAIKKFIEYVLGEDAEYEFRYESEEPGCELYVSNEDDTVGAYLIDAWDADDDLDELSAIYNYCFEKDLIKGLKKYLEKKGISADGSFDELCERVQEQAEADGGNVFFRRYEYVDWRDYC